MAKKTKAATVPTQSITIPQMNTCTAVVTIKGDTPLIVHNFGAKARQQMADAQGGKARAKKAPKDPKQQYEDAFHRLPALPKNATARRPSEYGFPASGVKKAMVRACSLVDGVPMTIMRMAVFVQSPNRGLDGNLIPIAFERVEMGCDPVRIGNGKTADLRYRPYFHEWSMRLHITFNANVITLEQVVNLLNLAGFSVGLGDWRPEKDGNHGRFHVELTEEAAA